MRIRLLLAAGVTMFATAASGAAANSVVTVKGIVVGNQRGVLLIASPTGAVRAIHGQAALGAEISAAGGKVVTIGRAHRAVIRGVLVRRHGSLTFISAAQHLLVVHTGRRLSSARDNTQPLPGTVVQTTVAIDDQGDLNDQGEQDVGQAGQVQVQAVIAAVGAGTVTLTVNGQTLTIPLPAGLTLPASVVGSQVSLSLSFANGQVTADDDQGGDDQGDDDASTSVRPSGATGVFGGGHAGHDGGHGD